ncbi:HAMP domain-containing protein [Actinoplanes sp. LDG1-06]|uniref:histidine kinase n=1 Tax=Paractinoplanes ovalisporus TaxID=2810368 RepID=A0ABS2AI18_9ACTN|nr:ATP-binding protein [Actinoplanes ovalisporus]MBM2619443.1 HAMP domain-containing protein [Actinoplanes ovalisporus]
MTLRSPRWRAGLICVLMLLAGMLTVGAAEQAASLWRSLLDAGCILPSGRTSTTLICRRMYEPVDTRDTFVVIYLAVVLVAGIALLNWAVRPIRDLAGQLDALGPQNFAYRVRSSRRRGEMAELAGAVNGMISRVAVGYESQRRFAADASHELRTPLAVQRTLIEVSLARNPSPEKLRVVAEQLLETNERNVRLIEALLVLSESERGLASQSALRLDTIVAAVVSEHRSAAAEASVTVTTQLAPRVVIGEQVLLERLVTNLVQNAIKYNRPGGTVHVGVGDDPALVVANTGDDVPAESVAGLFEPFHRLNGVRIDHSGGVGLGLTIARAIVHAHDGTIAATSTGHDGLRVAVMMPYEIG